jgi:hypothetical protein
LLNEKGRDGIGEFLPDEHKTADMNIQRAAAVWSLFKRAAAVWSLFSSYGKRLELTYQTNTHPPQ